MRLIISGLLFRRGRHLRGMNPTLENVWARTPAEPTFPPVQDPIDPPENPDVPVREPDPEDPGQI